MLFGVFVAGAARFRGKVTCVTVVLMATPALTACLGNNGPEVVALGQPAPQVHQTSNTAEAPPSTAQPTLVQSPPAKQTAMPAPPSGVTSAKVVQPQAGTRPPTTRSSHAVSPPPAPAQIVSAQRAIPRNPRPERPAERHVLKFYTPIVKVYDKPYGTLVTQMQAAQFPKERMASGGEGVPVYKDGTAFIELAVASDSTGWVKIEDVAMSARPCKVDPRSSPGASGPVGAGSSSAACIR